MLTKGILASSLVLIPPVCPLCRYVVHVLLAIATIGFAFAHSAILVAIGVAAWVLDLLLRYVWMAGGVMGAVLPRGPPYSCHFPPCLLPLSPIAPLGSGSTQI